KAPFGGLTIATMPAARTAAICCLTVSKPQPLCSMSRIRKSAPAPAMILAMPGLANSNSMVPKASPPSAILCFTGLAGIADRSVAHEVLLDDLHVRLDAEAWLLGDAHAAVDELDRVARERPADLRRLDAVLQDQGVGHSGQEVQRGCGIDVGGEIVVRDRDA